MFSCSTDSEKQTLCQPCSAEIVPPGNVPDLWAEVRPLLEPAIDLTGGRMSARTVFSGLALAQYQLWLLRNETILAAGVTEFRGYPTGLRTLAVLLIGGNDMRDWVHLWSDVEAWAKRQGCTKIEISGRRGWSRMLGWKETTIDMEKDLIDG